MATSDEELAIIDATCGIICQVTVNTHYRSIQCQGLIVTIASLQGAVQQLVSLVAKSDHKMFAFKFTSGTISNEIAKIQDMTKDDLQNMTKTSIIKYLNLHDYHGRFNMEITKPELVELATQAYYYHR